MRIIKSYLTNNPCYKENLKCLPNSEYRKFQIRGPKGIMIHSVGCPQPSAKVFINNWNKSTHKNSCVHAFVESSGDVYQTLPWNYRAWHCGSSANNTHIGIEMCEPDTIKYTAGSNFIDYNSKSTENYIIGTYTTTVDLCVSLCKQYNLNPKEDGIIISHKEGSKRGIASNHGDPEHLWSKFGLTMDMLRKDVYQKLYSNKNDSFRVKVVDNELNIRKGPNISYPIIGVIRDQGVYTILETKGDWGLLKSYARNRGGWINLKYTKKL